MKKTLNVCLVSRNGNVHNPKAASTWRKMGKSSVTSTGCTYPKDLHFLSPSNLLGSPRQKVSGFVFHFLLKKSWWLGDLPWGFIQLLHWNYFFPQVEYSLFNPIKQEPFNPKIVLKSPRLAF